MSNLVVTSHNGARAGTLPSLANSTSPPLFKEKRNECGLYAGSDFVVLSKYQSGFVLGQIADFREKIEAARQGAYGQIRYLVLDLVGDSDTLADDDPAFLDLAAAVETLVRSSAIISVASVRGRIAGADLELALAANLLVADAKASFSFESEPASALGLYGCLAKKLGFVMAERLMDQGKILTADQMRELFLVKEILDLDGTMDALWRFLERSGRRHNASHAIYRAQSIASPSIYQSLTASL